MDIRKLGFGIGAFVAGAAFWTWGASRFGDRVARALDLTGVGPDLSGGHPAPDLAAADPAADPGRAPAAGGERAPPAFRPDPTAIPTAAEREALRPATGSAPTLAADRGSGFAEAAGAA